MRRPRWLALALLAPLLLAACGGDDEPSPEEVKKPELTVPQDEESTDTTETTEPEAETGTEGDGGSADGPMDQPNPGNGGVPAPDNNEPAPEPRDSPANDTPPEPGSPAERFEQFCAQNPGAC